MGAFTNEERMGDRGIEQSEREKGALWPPLSQNEGYYLNLGMPTSQEGGAKS